MIDFELYIPMFLDVYYHVLKKIASLIFLFFKINSSLIQYISTPSSAPSTPPSPPHLPSPPGPFPFPIVSLQKRAGIPGISIKHGITILNKSRHKPSFQGLMKQPSRRKGVTRAGKRVSDNPHFHS